MTWREQRWGGVFAATLCAFHSDESLDEEGLQRYFTEVAEVEGIEGLTCNGHTGEVMSLRPVERARVTRLCVDSVREVNKRLGRKVRIISGVSAEGSLEAVDHALAAKEAGADAILLMPPHHWLRFGRTAKTAVSFIEDVAVGADIPIVIHQYPAWTKAGYSLAEMQEMVALRQVVAIKMGTRDMARWKYDYDQLKARAPHVSIITCHDEFLLPSLIEGCDGALVGFAGFSPELIIRIVHCALDGDLAGAKVAQATVAPLARLIYDFGEPGCGAHQRMKVARWLMNKFPSPMFRRPVRPLAAEKIRQMRGALVELGFACRELPEFEGTRFDGASEAIVPYGSRRAGSREKI